ncbi:MAG: hypothetical protein O7B81_07930 [Gammaproteobacteria bacterium]|nr:hypothetical protein [Gammaproteobacteria bacterium]
MCGIPFLPCRNVARVAALFSFLGLAWHLVRPAAAEEFPQPLTTEHYTETLLNPEPIDGDTLSLDPEPYVNNKPWYELPARSVPWYYARFRGGASYFDVPSGSRSGGEYGGNVVVPLVKGFAAYGNLSLNHFSGGTQVLGTVGMLKIPRNDATGLAKGLSWMVMFDQFTDTRIDDLYLSSLQVGFSKSLNARTSIGAIYTEPLEEDNAQFVLFPGAAAISVPLSPTRGVKAYLSRRFESTQVSGWVGYRDAANTVGYGGSVRRALNDRVSAIANLAYEDVGLWSGFAGIEIAFGRPKTASNECGPSCAQAGGAAAGGDVVRGGPKVPRYFFLGEDNRIYETFVKEKKDHWEGLYSYPLAQRISNRRWGLSDDSASAYGRQVDGMDESMQMMQMMQNGGIDFNADCTALVTQLLAAGNGDVGTVATALLDNGRTECLDDPRLFGE